ncbi:hypothetical protein BUALT_Bualt17G0099200 [Buddleja alternifolia]|uniref:VQ domain-containing protein n=1 Tax=Buddleja alternifolia TaxID=168488 RepID=A0AAV6WI23_9LAMI|nr:hypothetical protein BUALT_Bualt17G0099200 [Buddleja alternifolia]
MSPSKFQDSDVTKGLMINGPRPLPLRINKDSHAIHKPSSDNPKHNNLSTKRQPVIIYTHSPKVIHAQARDFMALVQKLTGLSRSDDEKTIKSESESTRDEDEKDKNVVYEDNESSSLTDEKFMGEVKHDSSAVSPMYKVNNAYMGDIPLYTPNTNELFCSSRNNLFFQSPTMATSYSNSYMDWMKGYPEL